MRKRIFPLLILACGMLLNGCFPGIHDARKAAKGVVVDAVTGAPLSGVDILYTDEKQVTDERGGFSFSRHIELVIYTIPGERRGFPTSVRFRKEGYVSRDMLPGDLGTVLLEPLYVPEGIAGMDASIRSVEITRGADGSVLAWMSVERSDNAGTIGELARATRAISEKLVRSGLVGATPEVVFVIGIPPQKEPRVLPPGTSGPTSSGVTENLKRQAKSSVWSLTVGWTGECLGRLDWANLREEQWLNSAAFAVLSAPPEAMFSGFQEGMPERLLYAPFLETVSSTTHIPKEFWKE